MTAICKFWTSILIFAIAASAGDASAQQKFSVFGPVNPDQGAETIFEKIKTDTSRSGMAYAFSGGRLVGSDKLDLPLQDERDFEIKLDLGLADKKITIRIVHEAGLVSTRDKIFIPNNRFHSAEGSRFIKLEDMFLAIFTDRYIYEMQQINNLMKISSYDRALARLDDINKFFLPPGPKFFTAVSKRRAQVIQKSLESGRSVADLDYRYVERVESNEVFGDLKLEEKFQIYIQFARAYLRAKDLSYQIIETGVSGDTILDVALYCFQKAIDLHTIEWLSEKQGWNTYKELIDALAKNDSHESAMEEISTFFTESRYRKNTLSTQQRKAVIYFLSTYGQELAKFTSRYSMRESKYIERMSSDRVYLGYWKRYYHWLDWFARWYSERSMEELFDNYTLAEEIISSAEVEMSLRGSS